MKPKAGYLLGALLTLVCGSAHCDWSYSKNPVGPGYIIKSSEGQLLSSTYKTEKAAKMAVKALNDAEKKGDKRK